MSLKNLVKDFKKKALVTLSKELVKQLKSDLWASAGAIKSTMHYEKLSESQYIVSHDPVITKIQKTYSYPGASVSDYGGIQELGRAEIDMKKRGANHPLSWIDPKTGEKIFAWKVKAVKPKLFYKNGAKKFKPENIKINL